MAGIIEVARLSSRAADGEGRGYELDATIAAVVLSGTSLAGGKGFCVGTRWCLGF